MTSCSGFNTCSLHPAVAESDDEIKIAWLWVTNRPSLVGYILKFTSFPYVLLKYYDNSSHSPVEHIASIVCRPKLYLGQDFLSNSKQFSVGDYFRQKNTQYFA